MCAVSFKRLVGRCAGAGRNSMVVARDFALARSFANFTSQDVRYFVRYARSTAACRRALRVRTARTGMARLASCMNPRGSLRKVRYQLRALMLHDRTKSRLSTTTPQMPMNRCLAPALMRTVLPSRKAARSGSGNRRGEEMWTPERAVAFNACYTDARRRRTCTSISASPKSTANPADPTIKYRPVPSTKLTMAAPSVAYGRSLS